MSRVVDFMSSSLSKRLFAGLAAASLGLAVTACGGGEETAAPASDFDDKDTVGILHSLTGTMAISESTLVDTCLLYTSPSPRDLSTSRMPSSA